MKTAMRRSSGGLLLTGLLWAMADPASAVEYSLRAEAFQKTMPDGASVTMWGYALDTDGNFATVENAPTVPGPVLTVPPGDGTLTVHLYNNLPQLAGVDEPVSLMIPGQSAVLSPVRNAAGRVVSMAHEASRLGTATYTWNNVQPGTYLYHSGSHLSLQVQMGLHGAMKKDAATGQAYAGVAYQQEQLLLFSEVDSALHQAVALGQFGPGTVTPSTINYRPDYFLINGNAYPGTGTGLIGPGVVGDQILLRFLNAGQESRVPVALGQDLSLVAEDGKRAPHARGGHSVHLPAGKTVDALLPVPSTPNPIPIYDRRLGLTSGVATPVVTLSSSGSGSVQGGMLTYLATNQDKDTVADYKDNCTLATNATQRDTNGDGHGNACDGDLNNDKKTNVVDYNKVKAAVGKTPGQAGYTLDADFNGDGKVTIVDLNYFKAKLYGKTPGPSCCTH